METSTVVVIGGRQVVDGEGSHSSIWKLKPQYTVGVFVCKVKLPDRTSKTLVIFSQSIPLFLKLISLDSPWARKLSVCIFSWSKQFVAVAFFLHPHRCSRVLEQLHFHSLLQAQILLDVLKRMDASHHILLPFCPITKKQKH